jgi:hypothetical protein
MLLEHLEQPAPQHFVIIGDQDSQHAEVAPVRSPHASGPRPHF